MPEMKKAKKETAAAKILPNFAPNFARRSKFLLICSLSYPHGPIRLHDAPRGEGGPAQAHHPEEHFPQLFPRREDRRARPQRLRQVVAAENHGGGRRQLRRR